MKLSSKPITKVILSLSIVALVVWSLLGTGTSLAWFTDRTEVVRNIFNFAEFDVLVEYKNAKGGYYDLEGATEIFDDEALYEPGYVEVIYLKITNNGDIPFDYKTAVGVSDYRPAVNLWGQSFNLRDHLEFGFVTADSETELSAIVNDRKTATELASTPLDNYESTTRSLAADSVTYAAVIIEMPESVGNVANHRSLLPPKIELMLVVTADQQKQ